jgi:ankyrin repeat protein
MEVVLMAIRSLCLMMPVLLHLALPAGCRGAAPPLSTERLIDALVDVKQGDFGYSPRVSGSTFLPLYRESRFRTGLLGGPPPVRSGVMVELVRRGARAVPHLLAHLDDTRPTGIVVTHTGGFGGMKLSEAADRNRRTQEPARERAAPAAPLESLGADRGLGGRKHTVTIGDLCYVALGQIVNRRFDAVRYKPSAIFIVSSPTRSPTLCKQLRADWKGLTERQHAAALINDFLKPDRYERRVGAAERLAYYYPHYLEPLALALLAQPTYPSDAVDAFVHDKLYTTTNAARCRELLEEFVKKHGEAAREGVMLALFRDLSFQEDNEEGLLSPPLTEFKDQPRSRLIGLFGKDNTVRSSDCPRYPEAMPDTQKAYFIETALVHDSSATIDRAILDLLRSCGDNNTVAKACLTRLVGRGHDAVVARHARRLQEMVFLEKLGYTRLHVAVEQGRDDLVCALLAKGASPAVPARNGKTPLHLAVASGYLDIIELLAASGQGLDRKGLDGRTALDLALAADDDQAVRALVAAGCAITDVRAAALADRPERAEQLVKEKPGALHRMANSKRTALHLAVQWGSDRALAVLLRRGAEVNGRDYWGATALHYAVWKGNLTAARLLLENKANVRAALPETYLEPVHLAARARDYRMTDLLLKHKADLNVPVEAGSTSLLHAAVTQDRPDLVAFLLEKGARVDNTDDSGATPLHRAVEAGKSDLVRLLLRHGADVNRPKGKDGPRPLHLAASKGSDSVAGLLLQAGASVGSPAGEDRETPLLLAAETGSGAVIRLLLARKAAVDAHTSSGTTPLHRAARMGDMAIVAMLLKAGASVRAATDEGWQPLHEAGSAAVARLLARHGADPNARSTDGTAPLHIAASERKLELAEALLACRAAVDLANDKGETPLHLAVSAAEINIVRLLLAHKANPRARNGKGRTPLAIAIALKNKRVADLLRRFTKE